MFLTNFQCSCVDHSLEIALLTTTHCQILKLNFHFVEVAGLPGYVDWWLKGVFLIFFKCIVYLDTVAIEAVDFCFISLNSQCTAKEEKKKKLWLKLRSWLWSWPVMVHKDLGSLRTVVKLKPAQSSRNNLKITALLKAVQGCTRRWSCMRDWPDFFMFMGRFPELLQLSCQKNQ